MRISDWSSDVCSSDLGDLRAVLDVDEAAHLPHGLGDAQGDGLDQRWIRGRHLDLHRLAHWWAGFLLARLDEDAAEDGAALADLGEDLVGRAALEPVGELQRDPADDEIGRASSRARVCQYV